MSPREPETTTYDDPALIVETDSDLLEFELDLADDELSELDTDDEIDPAIIEDLKKTHNQYKVGAFVLTGVLAIGLPYAVDVNINRLEDTSGAPLIKTVAAAPKGVPESNANAYMVNGFDTDDADSMDELAPAFQQVSPDPVKSVDFEKSNLDSKELAKGIINDAERKGKTHISLVGNSGGGIIVLEVALEIIKTSDIKIDFIYLIEMPNGPGGLKAGSKEDLALLMDWIYKIPGSESSNYLRDIVTTSMESENFTDDDPFIENVGDFWDTFWRAVEQTRGDKRARMELLYQYGRKISNANVEATISNMGELKNKEFMPTVINILSNPKRASVTDTPKSLREVSGYLTNAGIDHYTVLLDSDTQIHTSNNFDAESNIRGIGLIKDALIESRERSESNLAMNNFGYYQKDTIANQ